MKPASAKQKGRSFQQFVRDEILRTFDVLEPDDVRSTSMGASGEDILLSPSARKLFPYSIECKNKETLNVWKEFEQAKANCGKFQPLLFIKKNRKEPLVVMSSNHFFTLIGELYNVRTVL